MKPVLEYSSKTSESRRMNALPGRTELSRGRRRRRRHAGTQQFDSLRSRVFAAEEAVEDYLVRRFASVVA